MYSQRETQLHTASAKSTQSPAHATLRKLTHVQRAACVLRLRARAFRVLFTLARAACSIQLFREPRSDRTFSPLILSLAVVRCACTFRVSCSVCASVRRVLLAIVVSHFNAHVNSVSVVRVLFVGVSSAKSAHL